MFESTGELNQVEAKRRAVVTASVSEVREAAARWAAALGWDSAGTGPAFLFFHFGQSLIWGGVDTEVGTFAQRGGTGVSFLARAESVYPGIEAEMQRVVDCLADDVLRDLADRGANIDPPVTESSRRNLERLRFIERWRRRSHWPLMALLVPAMFLIWFVSKNPYFVLGGGALLVGVILGEQTWRLRAIGMWAGFQIGATAFIVLGGGVMLLLGALAEFGRVPMGV